MVVHHVPDGNLMTRRQDEQARVDAQRDDYERRVWDRGTDKQREGWLEDYLDLTSSARAEAEDETE